MFKKLSELVTYRFVHKVHATVIKIIIKYALLFLRYLLSPFFKLQDLKKRHRCPPIEDRILLLSATELAQKIRKREVSHFVILTIFRQYCCQTDVEYALRRSSSIKSN